MHVKDMAQYMTETLTERLQMCNTFEEEIEENRNYWFDQWSKADRENKALQDKLTAAEERARVAEEGWKDPVILHTHILRTLNHSQIMHIVGDDVAAEVTRLTTKLEKCRSETWESATLAQMNSDQRNTDIGEGWELVPLPLPPENNND